jgi:hypothetical protein
MNTSLPPLEGEGKISCELLKEWILPFLPLQGGGQEGDGLI